MTRPEHRKVLRRRRESRTDYAARKKLLLSGQSMLVTRKTSKYVYASICLPSGKGDVTLASACSKELSDAFDLVSLRNLPSAYLTGLLAGRRARERNLKTAVVCLGPAWSPNASIPFAVAQGCVDAGLKIPVGGQAEVDQDRLRGQHIAQFSKKLRETGEERFSEVFSRYARLGVDPQTLPETVDSIKLRILESGV
ncbi:MAG: 50S ribosomal protein L18 [Candidatus Geothermarchaeales archaeon]